MIPTTAETGTFYGAPVDWQAELNLALELMGQRSTDLERLSYNVGLLYLRCPEEWKDRYCTALQLITRRALYAKLYLPPEEVASE